MRNVRKLTALALATVGVLAFTSAPAWAGNGYEKVTTTFGSKGTGAGQFEEPTAVAVFDEAGNEKVYVLDSGNDRVEWFKVEAANKYKYEGQFNGSGEDPAVEGKAAGSGHGETPTGKFLKPGGIAVDNTPGPSYGDVYVADAGPGHEVVDKFSASGKYEGQLTGTCTEAEKAPPACEGGTFVPFVGLKNVAVDPAGDVWVYESNGPESPAGRDTPADEISATGSAMEIRPLEGTGAHAEFPGFAVDSSGDVFVVGGGDVYEYPRGGQREGVISDASELASLAVIDANSDLLVNEGSSIELFKSPISGGALPLLTFPVTGLAESAGIAVNGAKGEGTIYATERGSDDVAVFEPAPAKAPEVVGESASTIGTAEEPVEQFAATIEPGNRTTTYSFEYSLSKKEVEEGKGTPVPGETTLLAEFGEQRATSSAVELKPLYETFYYRVVAENEESKGTPTYGKVEAYTKLPLVENEQVSRLTSTSAKFEAVVNSVFQGTEYWFEYAREAALLGTSKAAVIGSTEKGGGSPELLETEISGLEPGHTYYYRVVAQSYVTKIPQNANKGEPVRGTIEEVTPYGAPGIVTGAAQNITGTAATLSGSVNPKGTEATYHFAYISETGFQYAIAHGAANPEAGEAAYQKELAEGARSPYAEGETTTTFSLATSASPQAVGPIPADDLLPGVTYHYALVAVNKYAIQAIGPDQTFTTHAGEPPLVSTGGASGVSQNSATLSGTVTTNGLQTSYGFEIGTEPFQPGKYVPATGLGAIGGAATEEVHVTLGELQPGTTYYYRVEATNADGTRTGQPESFTTPGFPTLISPPASALLIPYTSPGFPKEEKASTGTTTKALTNKQKLAKALKQCKRDKSKTKRVSCEKAARKKYPTGKKKRKVKK